MQKNIYLDYAATTPIDPRIKPKICSLLTKNFGNSASIHSCGQKAKLDLKKARKEIAGFLNCQEKEIIFTGSATESNNMALKGIAYANLDKGNHIIISNIEHPCIMNTKKWLETQGFSVSFLEVDSQGFVNPKDLENLIQANTILVSVMHVNNETGAIQPIEEIGKICKKYKIYFHTDATQSFGKININLKKTNIDLLTASSHKIYGPKGAGLLYVKKGVKIEPLLHGGEQEFGLRSGTINTFAIVGFSESVKILKKEMKIDFEKAKKIRQKISEKLKKIPNTTIISPENSIPNILNVSFNNIEGESVLMLLDQEGICVSTGSACSSKDLTQSHVLRAMKINPQVAQGSIRVSWGRFTSEKDINQFLDVLPKIVKKLRSYSPLK